MYVYATQINQAFVKIHGLGTSNVAMQLHWKQNLIIFALASATGSYTVARPIIPLD